MRGPGGPTLGPHGLGPNEPLWAPKNPCGPGPCGPPGPLWAPLGLCGAIHYLKGGMGGKKWKPMEFVFFIYIYIYRYGLGCKGWVSLSFVPMQIKTFLSDEMVENECEAFYAGMALWVTGITDLVTPVLFHISRSCKGVIPQYALPYWGPPHLMPPSSLRLLGSRPEARGLCILCYIYTMGGCSSRVLRPQRLVLGYSHHIYICRESTELVDPSSWRSRGLFLAGWLLEEEGSEGHSPGC